jgi:hypothetical protein
MISDVRFPKITSLGTSLDQKHNRTIKRCLIVLEMFSSEVVSQPRKQ